MSHYGSLLELREPGHYQQCGLLKLTAMWVYLSDKVHVNKCKGVTSPLCLTHFTFILHYT